MGRILHSEGSAFCGKHSYDPIYIISFCFMLAFNAGIFCFKRPASYPSR